MSRAANRTVLSGILTRILQSTSDSELITTCILALRYEAQHHKLDGCLLKQVIAHARAKARERNEINVEGALAKASPASISEVINLVGLSLNCLLCPKPEFSDTSICLVPAISYPKHADGVSGVTEARPLRVHVAGDKQSKTEPPRWGLWGQRGLNGEVGRGCCGIGCRYSAGRSSIAMPA